MTEYARHLFRAFDTDKDGLVSFEEVIIGFHHLSGSGDEREKLKLVFHVSKSSQFLRRKIIRSHSQIYDVDGNKVLCPANVKE